MASVGFLEGKSSCLCSIVCRTKVVVHADPWTFYCAVCSETINQDVGTEPGWDENAHLQVQLRVRLRGIEERLT
jgi:hypothetical protein